MTTKTTAPPCAGEISDSKKKFAPGTKKLCSFAVRPGDHPLLEKLGRIDPYQYVTREPDTIRSIGMGYELWSYQTSPDDRAGLTFEVATEDYGPYATARVSVWDRSQRLGPCHTPNVMIHFDSRADAVAWIEEFVGTSELYPAIEWVERGERYVKRSSENPRGHGLPDMWKLGPARNIASAAAPEIRLYPKRGQ